MKKFKIKETGNIVEKDKNGFYYVTNFVINFDDIKELGLTLEPIDDEPKKLYAYKTGLGIAFVVEESDSITGDRAPEYDLTFGDKK